MMQDLLEKKIKVHFIQPNFGNAVLLSPDYYLKRTKRRVEVESGMGGGGENISATE